ncbi:TrmH family RNA methyltransferase [Paenibacillus thermoaerophilus]|uniref:TrmH family RNA methyltransferase n=1 Tax=Paenibacillus thermoaerophilus TaxID=1215385 RepID=A0ABW2V5Z1_9BACL|nr:RNA methyltransferase [Paenibacillus thermoaerophilus]TMV18523.1 RNA methyltransferase [Paenibacillus thermoaerophilus]
MTNIRTEVQIQSVQNPRVKEWAQLAERKHRDRQGKYIIEGVHLVQEALRHGADIETVLLAADRPMPEELREFAPVAVGGAAAEEAAGSSRIEWIGVSPAVMDKLADAKTPQGVAAVVRKPSQDPAALLRRPAPLVVAVDGVQDPGNLGAIIRSADAAGADGVLLGRGTVDLYNPKTLRSTMGSLYHLPVIAADLPQWLRQAREAGHRTIGMSLQAKATLYETDLRAGSWIVLGNEGQGLSPEVQAEVDTTLIIPMKGAAESLNVAMAGTVVLFEALRQRGFSPDKNSCS